MPVPTPCSALALDVGHRRIGMAGCDALGLTVTALATLRRGRFADDLDHIAALVIQRRVEALVVGLPLDRRAQGTAQSRHCRRYGESLGLALAARDLVLPVAWVNEQCSSWEAGERFALHGDRTGRLDGAAAALLLEQWLREGPIPELVRKATIERRLAAPVASL